LGRHILREMRSHGRREKPSSLDGQSMDIRPLPPLSLLLLLLQHNVPLLPTFIIPEVMAPLLIPPSRIGLGIEKGTIQGQQAPVVVVVVD